MPVLLFILLLPVIEIYVFIQVASKFGIVNALFALLAACVLGAGIAKAQGRYMLAKMQSSLAQGQVPTHAVVHGLLIFIGGVLFLIPGFATDAAALLFVIPGPRHLLVNYFRRRLEREVKSGKFRVFTAGSGAFGGGFGGFGGGFGQNAHRHTTSHTHQDDLGRDYGARDVTPKVIDITPVSSKTTEKPEPPSDS